MSELSYSTNVHVANRALDIIGTDVITTIDDTTKEGLVINRNIATARRAVLRLHFWNFAIKRATLTTLGTTPTFGYGYALTLPTDYLRVKAVDDNETDYRIERGALLTDATSVELEYVYDNTTITEMDPLFIEAWAHYLAWLICYKITASQSQKDQLWKDFLGVMRSAKFVDSTDDPARDLDRDEWIRARMGCSCC